MDKEHVWIRDYSGNIYYCEIKNVNKNERFGIIEYEVFPIIGSFKGFTTLINAVLTSPSVCMMWTNVADTLYANACYDLNRLIDG